MDSEQTPFKRATTAAVAVSQAALTSALLYYFGLAYTRAWYGHFGVGAPQLNYGISDYIVASINGGFFPVLLGLLVFAGLLALRSVPAALAARTRRPERTLRIWTTTAGGAGAALCAAVAVCVAVRDHIPSSMNLVVPLLLLAGVGLGGHAVQTHATTAPPPRPATESAPARRPAPASWLLILTLLLIGFLGAFWAVNNFATDQAHRDATAAERDGFPNLPVVVLYSVDRLAIEGRHTQTSPVTTPGEKYRYQYSGLLLLARTDDRYYIIPYDWSTAQHDRVFVISTSDTIRTDIAPHPTAP